MMRQDLSLRARHVARHLRYGLWRIMHRTGVRAVDPPLMVDSLADALARPRLSVRFPCPTDLILFENALAYGAGNWNPYSATARALAEGSADTYAGSILERFYLSWRPASAAEAVAGLGTAASGLRALPPHGLHVSPWRDAAVEKILAQTEAWHLRDMSQNGHPTATIERVGFNRNGPVADTLGSVEMARLSRLVRQIGESGYDPTAGLEIGELGIRVEALRRGREMRYLNCGGVHRTAVLDALGAREVPAHLLWTRVVDRDSVDDWPHVRSGLWSRREALRYFDHLFDFDSRAWAEARGLAHRLAHAR